MEPFTTAALAAALTTLVNGAAGEAGKSAWNSLTSLVRSRLGRDSQPVVAIATLEQAPDDQEAAQQLASALEDVARTDHTAATWLHPWFEQAHAIVQSAPQATNIISGNAQVNTAVQGNVFTGDLHIS
jgi:hypothetical protein